MSKQTITLPAFGSAIAGQGGYFAAIMRGATVDGVQQPAEALLVSDIALEIEAAEWGKYSQDVAGATSRTDGKANTDAMVAANCPAALRVREVSADGHTDYFLPSLGELNSAAANVPELFNKAGCYWTSTQVSRDDAFVQDFENGGSSWNGKGGKRRVRAFRRISLDLLNT